MLKCDRPGALTSARRPKADADLADRADRAEWSCVSLAAIGSSDEVTPSCFSFASSCLRDECRFDLWRATGGSDGVSNPEFVMNRYDAVVVFCVLL